MTFNRAPAATIVIGTLIAVLALPALAASLGSTSRSLAAGVSAVSRCDPDGIKVAIDISTTNVVSVTGSGIAATCGGLTMQATVTGATTQSGSVVVPVGGGAATATLAAAVAIVQSLRVDVVVGP